MGFRLPLDSLPWAAPADREPFIELDPFAPRGPLPPRTDASPHRGPRRTPSGSRPDGPAQHEPTALRRRPPRTASPTPASSAPLCASSRATAGCTSSCRRSGSLEDYLDLVAAVEDTAAELQMPVLIEGYPPPHDHRLNHFKRHARPRRHRSQHPPGPQLARAGRATRRRSTRRPGRRAWARRNSCSTAGTPAPAAATTSSSAARRPPTARSCAGPTCCAACSATGTTIRRCRICSPACSSARPARRRAWTRRATTASTSWRSPSGRSPSTATHLPWLVDRVFRNLLIDVTGNTHRAEFCIDKLYSPDASRRPARPGRDARLRDAAARAHEPGAAAAACAAWSPGSGRRPTSSKLARWGTELHDRFLLPHFIEQDFQDVLIETAPGRASRFEDEWFAPHFEFRFPAFGGVGLARRPPGAAPGARALARPGRGGDGRRHGPLRRFLGRARAGQGATA